MNKYFIAVLLFLYLLYVSVGFIISNCIKTAQFRKCPFCGDVVISKDDFIKHLEDKHPDKIYEEGEYNE